MGFRVCLRLCGGYIAVGVLYPLDLNRLGVTDCLFACLLKLTPCVLCVSVRLEGDYYSVVLQVEYRMPVFFTPLFLCLTAYGFELLVHVRFDGAFRVSSVWLMYSLPGFYKARHA